METISFKFDGKGVATDALGRDLLPLANSVYNLVQSCCGEEARLLSIENNCVKMTFARAAVAVSAIAGMAGPQVLDAAQFNAAARSINSMLARCGATLEISDVQAAERYFFNAQSAIPLAIERHEEIKTVAAIYGELLDAGGVEPNIHISSDAFKGDVILKVERDDARKLAKRLYEQVGVNASLLIRDGRVVGGKVLEVIDYAPEDISEWLAKTSGKLGAEAFVGVDVAAFIAEQRA